MLRHLWTRTSISCCKNNTKVVIKWVDTVIVSLWARNLSLVWLQKKLPTKVLETLKKAKRLKMECMRETTPSSGRAGASTYQLSCRWLIHFHFQILKNQLMMMFYLPFMISWCLVPASLTTVLLPSTDHNLLWNKMVTCLNTTNRKQ